MCRGSRRQEEHPRLAAKAHRARGRPERPVHPPAGQLRRAATAGSHPEIGGQLLSSCAPQNCKTVFYLLDAATGQVRVVGDRGWNGDHAWSPTVCASPR
jgi:hypothetical protein